ncbi:MAG: PHP domain-containing protein [Vicinamibacterales bacterium]
MSVLGRLTLAAAAAVAVSVVAVLPPSRRVLDAPVGMPAPRGVMHVHTVRSDGSGSVEAVARAARQANLDFVVLTDHGDGMRPSDAPRYVEGVLLIDAVEISTDHGHVVALGLPPAPYPLGGEARDVVQDVRRLGAFTIAAHPESSKAELRWDDWDLPLDGLEWLNGDSQWRDESWRAMLSALLTYPARPAESVARLLDRPEDALRRWDELTRTRQVVGVAGADAHARLGPRGVGEPFDSALTLPFPSYASVFPAFVTTLPGVTLTLDPVADARAVLAAIAAGHVVSAVDALAGPGMLELQVASGEHAAAGGDVLPLGGPVSITVRGGVPEATLILVRDGETVSMAQGTSLTYAVEGVRAVYRAEARLPGAPGEPPVPWLVSNPVYVGLPRGGVAPPQASPITESLTLFADEGVVDWRVERRASAEGAVDVVADVGGTEVLFRYALSGRESEGPYVALVLPTPARLPEFDRLRFSARADKPMRVSVQLRGLRDGVEERWNRSVYLDERPVDVVIPFEGLTRVAGSGDALSGVDVSSLMFVVDTVNTRIGSAGRVWVDDVALVR